MLAGSRWWAYGVQLRPPSDYMGMIVVILRSIPVTLFKQGDRDASEYHHNHSHVVRGGSKLHPVGPPAASCQHTVLIEI